ncbi:MAG: DUF4190 domain-containing protein [Lachnospiraceae bacterium]|nr:DUF4190 domain-containing protein [Lachnospiraceae bacterium]
MDGQYNGGAGMGGQSNGGAGMAIAAMVLGIFGLLLGCCLPPVSIVIAVVSIILAAMAIKKNQDGKGMAIAGLVCSAIAVLMDIIFLVILGGATLSEML